MSVFPVPALYAGVVQHRRKKPLGHLFRYRVYQALVDLDDLEGLAERIPFFSHNRFNVVSIDDRDHMGTGRAPIKEKLRAWLAGRGVEMPDKVLLLTNLRVLGYVFNPVSYYYAYGADGRLAFGVAEINNTFGETYAYLLPLAADGATIDATFPKAFHISPFISMDATYRFVLTPPAETLRVSIDEWDGPRAEGETFFEALFAARRRPLDGRSLARALVTHPHMPLRVITAIHWQALRLWLKRLEVFHKPAPPPDAIRRSPSA